jgi:periplasmic divalent cation tolerance protein
MLGERASAMEDGYILILTTVANEEEAGELARSIVAAGLAACVQMQPIRSVYRWKGEVCEQPEWRLMIKTAGALYARLEQHIKANHTYATPAIVRVEITGGSPETLAWIDECTGGEAGGQNVSEM